MEVIKNIGLKSVLATTLVFLLTAAATGVGGYQLYKSTKESIELQGKVNAVQSAKELDNYLIVRKNTVVLAAHVVDDMIVEGKSNKEILDYITAESASIKKAIDKDYTGLYGWINGEYLDGVGWVPPEDFVPTERPWYQETMADQGDVSFITPYLDEHTGTVLTTIAKQLSDGVNVVALDVSLQRVQEITGDITRQSPDSFGLVLSKTGQVVAHSDRAELGKNYLDETGTLGAVLAEKLYHDGGRQFVVSFHGQKYMVYAERIEGDWQSLSLIHTEVFYRPLKIVLALLVLFTLLEAVIFISVIYTQSAKSLAITSAKEAQSANRAKSQFLSRMSHEIRTPINAIIGLNSIVLRDESISGHTREELEKVDTSAKHLLSIVNDILDMSRIESGRMTLKEEEFSFRELLDQVSVIIGGQCEEKGLRFICNRNGPLSERYIGDCLKIKQIIINILGNSVKFTDQPGTITFAVAQTAIENDKAVLCFIMKDTGIGMDKEFIPRLFDAFTQEDSGNTSRYHGSGLGMAITKRFVEMMGGTINVESQKGVGTTFTVSIPLGLAQETSNHEEQAEAAPSLSGLHLMIAEDQPLNAEILIDLLEMEEITTEWVENGKLAVDLFAQNDPGHFDAILMDMRMPVMDGLTAAREIRKLARPDAKTIPIIALTANAFEEDVKECLQAGMNAHLSKPVDIDLLKTTLGKTVSNPSPMESYHPAM